MEISTFNFEETQLEVISYKGGFIFPLETICQLCDINQDVAKSNNFSSDLVSFSLGFSEKPKFFVKESGLSCLTSLVETKKGIRFKVWVASFLIPEMQKIRKPDFLHFRKINLEDFRS